MSKDFSSLGEDAKQRIGAGAASQVFKIRYGDDDYVVRKTLGLFSSEQIASFRRQCEILRTLRDSEYVQHLLGACINKTEGIMLLEYVEGRTMTNWLKENPSEVERLRVYRHLLRGLRFLHERGFAHLDIQPSNIWIPLHIGLPPYFIDFELAQPIDEELTETIKQTGTKNFLPVNSSSLKTSRQRNYWALGRVIGQYNDISYPTGSRGMNMEVVKHKTPEMGTPVGTVVKYLQEFNMHTPANFNLLSHALIPHTAMNARVGGGGAKGGSASAGTRRARRNKKLTRRHRRV